jgi:hypothetical protein
VGLASGSYKVKENPQNTAVNIIHGREIPTSKKGRPY